MNARKRVLGIGSEGGKPIGTGFNLMKPGLVVTARHVVDGHKKVTVVDTSGPGGPIGQHSSKIMRHDAADIAVILVAPQKDHEFYEIGAELRLGDEVASMGYPIFATGTSLRFMKGHIQRTFTCTSDADCYRAFELGFPAFRGQSGSPVFFDGYTTETHDRNKIVGLVTRYVVYDVEEGDEKTSVRWAVGAWLRPFEQWIHKVSEEHDNRWDTAGAQGMA